MIKQDKVLKDLHPNVQKRAQNFHVHNGHAYDEDGVNIDYMVDISLKATKKQTRWAKRGSVLQTHADENGGFVLAFFKQTQAMAERFPSLSQPDIARLIYIGSFVAWETGRLQSDNGLKCYRKADLLAMAELSDNRFKQFFNKLVAEGILTEDIETGELFINKTVFFRGDVKGLGSKVKGMQHAMIYRDTIRDLFAKSKGRKLAHLALIYSVLPYLNFKTNILAHNQMETVADLIKPINLTELAGELNYLNAQKLKAAMNGVKIGGKPVFTYVEDPEDRREKRIIVNPSVIYGGDGASLDAIKALFN